MSTLTVSATLALSFLASAAVLAVFQTWVRLKAPPPAAVANFRRCLWVAFVAGVWWPWVLLTTWDDHHSTWASLSDQRLFLAGVGPTLWMVGLTSSVHPWAYSIRGWLLAGNLIAIGLFYGLFVGTAAWPGDLITYQWLFWSAVGFGMSLWHVLQSKPGQTWSASAPSTADLTSNSRSGTGSLK